MYNSLVKFRQRYTDRIVSPQAASRLRGQFVKLAGPSVLLLVDFANSLPEVSCTIKDAHGRVMFTNRYNLSLCGWKSESDVIGYTSDELYPPDQARVYAGRDREVLSTGKPIVNRIYDLVADRSASRNCVTVRPIIGISGRPVGTVTFYRRTKRRDGASNWQKPIQRAISYLHAHYAESISVERLAEESGYSVAQFRKLFARLVQMSPSTYLLKTRVNAAQTLLTTTEKLITDIAAETGFCDHSHFIKTFRKLTGLTPNAFRQRHIR